VRTVQIVGPGARGEGARVLQAAAAIAVVALLVIGRNGGLKSAADAAGLAPYQLLFTDLAPTEQRMVRQIQEGILEQELARGDGKPWPTPEQLADDGVPPFAADPLNPKLTWVLQRDGYNIDYLGVSPDASGPAYLVLYLEPEPGVPGDPPDTPVDETHHRLRNGVMIHASLWVRPTSPRATGAAITRPFLEGWKQILLGPPTLPKEQR
jgi:hypothetical protein